VSVWLFGEPLYDNLVLGFASLEPVERRVYIARCDIALLKRLAKNLLCFFYFFFKSIKVCGNLLFLKSGAEFLDLGLVRP
jgi:hypothetical protein